MSKKTKSDRFNVTLYGKDVERLYAYCVAITNRNGKIPHALKAKIGRMAFKEWLDKHEKDLTINFDTW